MSLVRCNGIERILQSAQLTMEDGCAITAGLYYAPSICWFWGEDKAKALGSTTHSDGIINLERIFNQSAQ